MLASSPLDPIGVVIRAALERARGRWPDVEVDETELREHLARTGSASLDAAELEKLALCDMVLAVACARADRLATHIFEAEVIGPASSKIRKMLRRTDVADELIQQLRIRLLVGREGNPPRVAQFSGRGSLVGWARVAAARLVSNHLTQARPEIDPSTCAWAEHLALTDGLSPEEEVLRQRYLDTLCQAYRDAASSLSERDRTLLYLSLVHRTSVDRLGVMYGVHRSTAHRWVGTAKERLLSRARELATQRLELTSAEVESIHRLLQSQLVLSFGALAPDESTS